jgi:SAM-dependent methyltransferase
MKSLLRRIKRYLGFIDDFLHFKKLAGGKATRFSCLWQDRRPCLKDKTKTTSFDSHYIYHLAWATRILAQNKPSMHIDISSSLYFSALVSAFFPVRFFDYRPANLLLDKLTTEAADLCALPFADQSVSSLSCMHVVEHIGLGRYGDQLDPEGDLKAVAELTRVLAPGGNLLFVVPVGKPRIQFNAHRIYSYDQILGYFTGLELAEFSLIPDNAAQKGLIRNASKAVADTQRYGCGCFWFRRPSISSNKIQ